MDANLGIVTLILSLKSLLIKAVFGELHIRPPTGSWLGALRAGAVNQAPGKADCL